MDLNLDGHQNVEVHGGRFHAQNAEELVNLYVIRLKERQNELKKHNTLQHLCLKAVTKHPAYFRYKEQPFECLPVPILTSLLMFLHSEGKLSSPKVLPLLLGPNCEHLIVKLQRTRGLPVWTPETVKQLFLDISSKCTDGLRRLELLLPSPCDLLSTSQLNDLLSSLPKLTGLNLSSCHLQNSSLEVIGATCPHLRCLDISQNCDVTDDGVLFLYNIEEPYGQCMQLEYLDLQGTKVTVKALILAIFMLQNLVTLKHRDVGQAIVKRIQKSKKPNLNFLAIDSKSELHANYLCNLIPNINSLDLIYNLVSYDAKHCSLLNLTSLKLRFFPLWGTVILGKVGYRLTKLDLDGFEIIDKLQHNFSIIDMDFSLIGLLCPHLQHLKFAGGVVKNCKHLLDTRHFTKLVTIDLNITRKYSDMFPVPILQLMFSSKFLDTAKVVSVEDCEEALLPVVEQALAGEQLLTRLRHLHLGWSQFTLEFTKKLVCCAPRLKTLQVVGPWGLKRFLQDNRIRVKLLPNDFLNERLFLYYR